MRLVRSLGIRVYISPLIIAVDFRISFCAYFYGAIYLTENLSILGYDITCYATFGADNDLAVAADISLYFSIQAKVCLCDNITPLSLSPAKALCNPPAEFSSFVLFPS